MRSHRWLIVPLVALCATFTYAQLDTNLNLASDPRFNKMLPKPQLPTEEPTDLAPAPLSPLASDPRFNKMLQTTEEPKSIEKPMQKIPLASDPTYNKMLPEPQLPKEQSSSAPVDMAAAKPETDGPATTVVNVKSTEKAAVVPEKIATAPAEKSKVKKTNLYIQNDIAHSEIGKDDMYDDYYYEDEYYDEDLTDMKSNGSKDQKHVVGDKQLKLIKGTDDKEDIIKEKHKETELIDDDIVDDDSDYDSDETDSPLDAHKGCPMNCVCQRNFNGYLVANCDRLDPQTMKFDSTITDLEVINVSPKYPLVLGAAFFLKMGLQHVSTIKIADTVIQSIHMGAFDGLDELYSVNLTNNGLDMLHPDTFARNDKLRILTLSGNDLHAMQKKSSPFTDYMFKAPSVEELYLSHCNIKELLPTAFNKMDNVVFISLADNQLKTLPLGIFDTVETIEELDLSTNSIENLPRDIFNKTSLAILNLRYNEISTRLNFIALELQKLDLSYNKLVNINELMFTNMPSVNSLMLRGNAIRKIHQTALMPLKELRQIDLSFNDLEQISSLIFLNNDDLDVIRINDNPRLKKLPMDGFVAKNGDFRVYLFDASNCAFSELGASTFNNMPQLNTLNLAWNNIENIGEGMFNPLTKLVKLDLSNNLIPELNDLVFLQTRALKKLNLAGNPLQKLSSKIFLPTKDLTELDVSDCNLKTIWTETNLKAHSNNIFKNLKVLNVSNNEIEQIRQTDLDVMDSLAVLDVSGNKIKCDEEFKTLIKWLKRLKVTSGHLRRFLREYAEMTDIVADVNVKENNISAWDEFSTFVCSKSTIERQQKDKGVIDTNNDVINGSEDDGEDDEDDDDEDDDDDTEENDTVKHVEDDDDDDDYGEQTDEEYDNDEAELKLNKGREIKDHGLTVEEVSIVKKVGAVFENEEEIILGHKYAFAGQYGYLLPILIVVFSVLAILLLVGKIMSIVMRRRGERYRQALLASKNSIVYQKLSEDIGGPMTPKFHRYAPINQV